MDLKISNNALDYITSQSYDPQYGARPVKRYMQRHILNELSKLILADKISKEKPILIDVDENGLVFSH